MVRRKPVPGPASVAPLSTETPCGLQRRRWREIAATNVLTIHPGQSCAWDDCCKKAKKVWCGFREGTYRQLTESDKRDGSSWSSPSLSGTENARGPENAREISCLNNGTVTTHHRMRGHTHKESDTSRVVVGPSSQQQ